MLNALSKRCADRQPDCGAREKPGRQRHNRSLFALGPRLEQLYQLPRDPIEDLLRKLWVLFTPTENSAICRDRAD